MLSHHHRPILVLSLLATLGLTALTAQPPSFTRVTIDADNPSDPHCKTLGDIDGDGLLDALAASSSGDGFFWYEYPSWTKHTIRASGSWTTDMQVGDVDDDGDLDAIIPNGSGLQWYENPRPGGDPRVDAWTEHLIGANGANNHDVEVGDVDGDLDLDVVSRRKGGNGTYFWRQESPTVWTRVTITTRHGEGVGLGDLDGDGDLDVAQNGFWSEQLDPDNWIDHEIAADWPDDVGVLIADVDDNGAQDVVIGPSESSGRLSWYSAPDPVAGPWTEVSIDPSVSFLHTFKAADMDFDGDLDLVTAEMHQSSDPDEVSVYLNEGGFGLVWSQLVVDTTGSHNVRVGDIGGDGDMDIYGANWNDSAPNSAVIEMWENDSGPLALDLWERHIVETSLPWQAVFVDGRDLDGDGLPDLVTGGWWYPNPGTLRGTWVRTAIGSPLNNMAAVHDFDLDGDADILGTDGQVSGQDLWWAQNDGSGSFALLDLINDASGGDFLQGVSVGQLVAGGGEEVVLSWHNGASGTSTLTVPADPAGQLDWSLTTISATTNEEQVPIGDVDGDGDLDVHLGDQWLRQDPGEVFTTLPGVPLSTGVPDRVVLADIDGDGDLDVVIGVEFGSLLVWGENQNAGATWVEHTIATDFDYFSVDAGDVDHDGDVDVVGGAHQGDGEVSLYENDGTGSSWTTHVVDSGDSSQIDHHDGTQLVDMDLDGDLDVISVGWTKRSLVIYENLAIDPGGSDVDPPTIDSVVAISDPNQVTVEFSEKVETTSAEDPANYTISNGVFVGAASLAADQRTVTLTTTLLVEGLVYTLTVNDVEDLAGNVIAPDTEAIFVYVENPLEAGLVAYWPLDQAAGDLALDASGNGFHGSLENGTRWIGGPALGFDGVDDHVDLGTLDVSGGELTLSAWVKSSDLGNCVADDCRILSKATGTAEDDHYFMLSTIASGGVKLRFRLKTDGATSTLIAGTGNLSDDVWHHAVAVYDGNEMRLYLDGALVGSTPKSGSLTTNAAVSTWIGGNPPNAAERPWAGTIDDVRIYDRALSEAEIDALPGPSARLFWTVGVP